MNTIPTSPRCEISTLVTCAVVIVCYTTTTTTNNNNKNNNNNNNNDNEGNEDRHCADYCWHAGTKLEGERTRI